MRCSKVRSSSTFVSKIPYTRSHSPSEAMSFEQELQKVADLYRGQGYAVLVRPGPEDLPPFAKDFQIELLARRGEGSALISVKKNLTEMSAEKNMPRYAQVIAEQPGWRYDFAIVEADNRRRRELEGAQELSD